MLWSVDACGGGAVAGGGGVGGGLGVDVLDPRVEAQGLIESTAEERYDFSGFLSDK